MAQQRQWNDYPLEPEVGPDDSILLGRPDGSGYRVRGDAVAPEGHRHDNATQADDGFMSAEDKTKLDGIDDDANNYEHPTGDGNHHVPATPAGSTNRWLKSGASAGAMAAWDVITKADVGLGAVANLAPADLPVSTDQQAALNLKEDRSAKGVAGGYASLDAAGKIPSAQMPPVAITEPFVVGSQATMLALTAQVGDLAIRTDVSKSYMLRAEPASTLANWIELLTPATGVMSINGKSGPNVSLTKEDIGLGSADDTPDAEKPVSTAQQQALDAKQFKLVPGANIAIDDSNPQAPVISASGGGGTVGVTQISAEAPTGLSADVTDPTTTPKITITYQAGYRGYTDAEANKLAAISSKATKNQTDAYLLNRANHTGEQAISTITNLQVTLDTKEDKAAKGAANGYASLGADGKIPGNQLPALAITDTFPVASQAAMLALTAQVGDIAIRSDLNKSFVLRVEPATSLANWSELLTPTDAVLSINNKTGAVTVSKGDVGLGNVDNTADANKPVSTQQQAALNAKLANNGGSFSGGYTGPDPLALAGNTLSPTIATGHERSYTNNSAFTLNAPSGGASGTIVIAVTNGASSGALNALGFHKVHGTFSPAAGKKQLLVIEVHGSGWKTLSIRDDT